MGMRVRRRAAWTGGIGAAVGALVGIGVALAPGATAAQALPPVTPEQLVESVMTAPDPGPLNGTVTVDNALGLPALPGLPQAANGTSSARVWHGGDGRSRLSLPTPQGEKTFVSDGTTRWAYDSEDRTATRSPQRAGQEPGPAPRGPGGADATDPATASRDLIGSLQKTSNVAVDGTGEVAGRPVYQLVLSPKPGERTLLREVRVAVDGEKRIPLQLTVLTNGSPDPALRAGFDDVTFGPQDPSLFTFTPPPGTTVEEAPDRGGPAPDQRRGPDGPDGVRPGEPGAPNVVGDGWDTVIVAQRPSDQQNRQGQPDRKGPDGPDGGVDLNALGTPVSGPWGSGRQITTAVGSAIIADDGRVAAGAVPPQVLVEALGT